MTLSRKDFFRGSLYALGDLLMGAGDALRGARVALGEVRDQTLCPPEQPEGEKDVGSAKVARVDDSECPAKSCGCFACLDRCEEGAISLVAGRGIVIDESLCTGCGVCLAYCPLAPQALALVPVRSASVSAPPRT